MRTFTVADAKAKLSAVLAEVEAGTEVLICGQLLFSRFIRFRPLQLRVHDGRLIIRYPRNRSYS